MKVKVGQFKTHLSGYLRKLKETGEPLEICVREESVAYLTPAKAGTSPAPVSEETRLMEQQLKAAGVLWDGIAVSLDAHANISPAPPADGKGKIVTVKAMRSERDW